MREEWLSCCSGSEEDCDGNHGAGCVAMQRVKFVLRHYAVWIRAKTEGIHSHDSDDDSSDGDSSDGMSGVGDPEKAHLSVMGRFEWFSDFMDELGTYCASGQYSYVGLSDDFEHIRDFHMKLNKLKTSETIQYLDGALGKCTDKECPCLGRHCRDRHMDNVNEAKRREMFFIEDGVEELRAAMEAENDDAESESQRQRARRRKKKEGKRKRVTAREERMWSEMNLQTKLDTMHITLRHHHLRLINTDKFITKVYGNESESGNGHVDEEQMQEDSEKDIFRRMTKYSFGESITYWDSKHHRYCSSKYADLRSELLHNAIYPLSASLYATIKNRAVSFLATKKGQQLSARREHDWMKKWKILKGSTITVDHVIALLCYVNVTALRRVFKLHGFVRCKKSRDRERKGNGGGGGTKREKKAGYEARERLLERHREIWHWSRLLLECVHCYGIPLSGNMNYYHGIDCKLLFNRFNVMFDIPTSLTLNRDIAYNLSRTINRGRGIAIELCHGGLSDLQSLSLDLSFLSDYPSEEEQLVFHSYLSFQDVIINRMHHDEWLKILRFWYKIKEGFFFNHLIESGKITRNDQLCICAMIINMIIANKKHPRYDGRIPEYMQNLFNECVENNTFVWIVHSEYAAMINKLRNLLTFDPLHVHKSSQFIQYLIHRKKCNVANANIFEWTIAPNHFNALFDRKKKNHWIASPQYTVYINSGGDQLHFHFEAQNKAKNNLFRCRIHLDHKPDHVAKINLGMGLFAKDANNFDNYSYGELRYDKLYNVSLHSLFPTKILRKNCKNQTTTLKLQIQLFYLYDFDGKLIAINQSQHDPLKDAANHNGDLDGHHQPHGASNGMEVAGPRFYD